MTSIYDHRRKKGRPQYVMDGYDVHEAALDRIRWIFREFDGKVCVSSSGGKDSTVIVELASQVARELGYTPMRVQWLDQETEHAATVEYQRYLAYERDDIDFRWYQVPFEVDNSMDSQQHWVNAWGPGEDWIRPQEPIAITENKYGQKRFHELLTAIAYHDMTEDWAIIDGVRVEESPRRRFMLLSRPQYKWITWVSKNRNPAKKSDQSQHRYRFHVIYDWTFEDVWKAISENGWKYNEQYDHMYRYGVPKNHMRVSGFTHETALRAVEWMQEVEPETWEAVTRRFAGSNTRVHLDRDQLPKQLPYAFASWVEYAAYLAENLPGAEEDREIFRKQLQKMVREGERLGLTDEDMGKNVARSIIGGDTFGTKVQNFLTTKAQVKGWEKIIETER